MAISATFRIVMPTASMRASSSKTLCTIGPPGAEKGKFLRPRDESNEPSPQRCRALCIICARCWASRPARCPDV